MTTRPVHCGIFGGTFDPIHLGHTGAVRQIVAPARLDEVRVIPAAVPPHRDEPRVPAAARLDMVRIALADEPGMVEDAREIERDGHSYTMDTVMELRAEFPGTRFSLILGLDAVLGLDRWHRWEDLLAQVAVIAMVRPGWTPPEPLPSWWRTGEGAPGPDSAGRIHLMAISPMDVSATRIRDDLRAGRDVRHLLHAGVHEYIRRHGLYSRSPDPRRTP